MTGRALVGFLLLAGCDERPSRPATDGPVGGSTIDAGPLPGPADAAAPDASAADAGPPDAASVFTWNLPRGFPEPVVPADNPMSIEKVELGRHLFYDKRLSRNETQSCASCHEQARAFTDGRATAIGSTGSPHPRSSMSLANVGYASTLTWANPLVLDLERQAVVPMFGDDPVELGLTSQTEIEQRLRGIPRYVELFARAFPGDGEPVTLNHLVKGLAAFERTLISGRSPLDRWLQEGDDRGLSAAAKRGYQLFNSEELECFHCHVGFNLSDHTNFAGKAFFDMPYHNTGLYNIDGAGAYPEPNTGVHHVTRRAADMGRFKAPTLRNIAVTAPYMHDGSIATLSEVLDHYGAGGRTIHDGPNAGNGSQSPLRSNLLAGFSLSEQDRADVIAFFESLTDEEFLTDPALSDPW